MLERLLVSSSGRTGGMQSQIVETPTVSNNRVRLEQLSSHLQQDMSWRLIRHARSICCHGLGNLSYASPLTRRSMSCDFWLLMGHSSKLTMLAKSIIVVSKMRLERH